MVGREKPETPSDQILSEEEWHVLSAWATGNVIETFQRSGTIKGFATEKCTESTEKLISVFSVRRNSVAEGGQSKAAANHGIILKLPECVDLLAGEIPYRIVRRNRFILEKFRQTVVLIRKAGCQVKLVFR